MVVVDALHGDSAAAAADELFGGGTGYADLLAFFDHTALEVKASGCGSDDEEELEWLSNKDAFPTVETMDSAGARPRTKGVRQSRPVVAWSAAVRRQCRHCGTQSTPQWREGPMGRRTLCNACGIKYRAGRLLPEYRPAKSPTFSSELHSNRHHRIVQLRRLRGEAVQTSLAAAGYGKEGGHELERLSNKSVFLAVDTMAPAGQRPRTKGLQRPRRVTSEGGSSTLVNFAGRLV